MPTLLPLLLALFAGPVGPRSEPVRQPTPGDAQAVEQMLEEAQRLLDAGKFSDALPLFQQAVERSEQFGNDRLLAPSLRGVGRAHWGLGKYEESLRVTRRALAVYEKLRDSAGQASCLSGLGLALYSTGRYDEALGHYEHALEENRLAPTPALEGTILANIGLVRWRQGRLEEATSYFEESLRIRRSVGKPGPIGQTLNHLGIVSRARGRYQRALEYYGESLEQLRKGGNRQGEAQTLNNTAAVFADLGQFERAIDLYQQALKIAEEIGYTAQIGFSNENIGANLIVLGRSREALARFEAALAVFRKTNRPPAIATVLNRIAGLRLFQFGDFAGARAPLAEALDVARAIGDRELESRVLLNLGALALRTGDAEEALERVEQALAIVRAVGLPELEYQVLAEQAAALRALGRTSEAIEALGASAQIVNDLRANVGSDFAKIGFMDARQAVFTNLADALWDAGRREEALEAAEAGRARAFADLLMHRQILAEGREGKALDALRTSIARLRQASPPGPGSEGANERPTATRSSDDVARALEGLRALDAELASLVAVESAGADEMRRMARDRGLTFVQYLLGERRLFVWVMRPDGALEALAVDVSRKRLDRLVTDLRRAIDGADLEALNHPERLAPTTRELDRLLIEPIAAWLPATPAEPVVLIPQGSLALLPFAALTDGRGQPLAARHTLALAPSMSVFRYTPAKRPARRAADGRALIVADPRPPADSGLAELAGTREEGARIAGHLPPGGRSLLTGSRATEAAVKRGVAGRSLIHFATHGLVSAERPFASSLLLGDGEGEDGYLRVDEVFGLDLAADLVVLSGCSTGLGRLTGDGIFGLSRAFIYAGTPSVVISQWDVSDRATTFLMERFYAALRAGRAKAAALREAQLAARRRYRHPALWAAFAMVGEPR